MITIATAAGALPARELQRLAHTVHTDNVGDVTVKVVEGQLIVGCGSTAREPCSAVISSVTACSHALERNDIAHRGIIGVHLVRS